MTFNEAMAMQPTWVGIWLNVLLLGGFVAPFGLLIWKSSRLAGVLGILAAGLGAFGVTWMYGQLGLVKLLGLPHILFWTPLVIYYIARLRSGELPKFATWLMSFSLVVILISLAFDYTDVARYFLGERLPLGVPDSFIR